ncbi:hypothetical protein DLREEDagrD3_28690 [Denitratisoma sp. agr-D3]
MAGFVKGRPWTPEEDIRLLAMIEGGDGKTLAATTLNRPYSSIESRLKVLRGRQQDARYQAPHRPRVGGKKQRPCMCCGNQFWSEGSHNRLCSNCKSKSLSPYAP